MTDLTALDDSVARVEAGLREPTGPALAQAADRLAAELAGIGPGDAAPRRALAVRGLLALFRERYRSGRFAGLPSLLRSADALSAGLSTLERIEVLLQVAEYGLLVYDIGAALGHIGEALAAARASGLKREEAKARSQLGMAMQTSGLHRIADAQFARALALIEGLEEPRLRGNLWALRFPVGFLLEERGDEAAEEAFRQSMACAEAAGPRFHDSMAVTAFCNRAAACIQRGRTAEARRSLDRAAALRNVTRNMTWMIGALRAIADIRDRNDEASRAALEAITASADPPARVFLIETWGVLAATYAAMGEAELAGAALARKSEDRVQAVWALLRATPEAPPARRGAGAGGGSRDQLLERLAVVAELRDDATGRHGYRMGRLAMRLGEQAGLAPASLAALESAARLHDIGKIAVPDSILLKAGPLDAVERRLMNEHAAIGARIVQAGAPASLGPALALVRHHHEHWDGGGYPDGLAGGAIPFEARIAAVADVFDALTHPRPYRRPWTREEAAGYIRSQRGRQFDPRVVDLFDALMAKVGHRWEDFAADLESAAADSQFEKSLADLAGVLGESP